METIMSIISGGLFVLLTIGFIIYKNSRAGNNFNGMTLEIIEYLRELMAQAENDPSLDTGEAKKKAVMLSIMKILEGTKYEKFFTPEKLSNLIEWIINTSKLVNPKVKPEEKETGE